MIPDARMMDFYDRHVSRMIVEKYGFDEKRAIRAFLESETYRMLADPAIKYNDGTGNGYLHVKPADRF